MTHPHIKSANPMHTHTHLTTTGDTAASPRCGRGYNHSSAGALPASPWTGWNVHLRRW